MTWRVESWAMLLVRDSNPMHYSADCVVIFQPVQQTCGVLIKRPGYDGLKAYQNSVGVCGSTLQVHHIRHDMKYDFPSNALIKSTEWVPCYG